MARKEKVTKVIDGDTFETNYGRIIRLANVDTPEKRQPRYQKAKTELTSLISKQDVVIDTVAKDCYNRSVANVKIGRKSVNNHMKKFKK